MLDGALYAAGKGSMTALADRLAAKSDLGARQIYASLRDWRTQMRAGQTFSLALMVAVELPGLLEELARMAGKVLVEPAGADTAGNANMAVCETLKATTAAIDHFFQVTADGRVTGEEREELLREVSRAQAALAGLVHRAARYGEALPGKQATRAASPAAREARPKRNRATGQQPGRRNL